MFSNFFLKSFRIFLLPFSLLYWLGISIRNWLYDKGISKSYSFGLPLICIGNLSVGGTGKSPMVEYLIALLQNRFKVATLSRGYKRRTKGYVLASEQTSALDIGDEPMQFHLKYPEIPVAVGEQRLLAIPQLLHDHPETEIILLDDAFQHRRIQPGCNILLTDYNNLFTRDFYLPTGDLRDLKSNYKRADVIIVTKCKIDLTAVEKKSIIDEINPLPHQQVYFTAIKYSMPYHILTSEKLTIKKTTEVLLVTGIANPKPLKNLLEEITDTYQLLQYSDHHIFTVDDLQEIKKSYKSLTGEQKVILTTEKDAVRLLKFKEEISALPFYVIPVCHQFLFGEEANFNETIIEYIQKSKVGA